MREGGLSERVQGKTSSLYRRALVGSGAVSLWSLGGALYRRGHGSMEGLEGWVWAIPGLIHPWGMRHPPRVGGREQAEFIGFFVYLRALGADRQKKYKRP